MNDLERVRLLAFARKLKQREDTSVSSEGPYSDMTLDERSKIIMELMAARQWDAEDIQWNVVHIDEVVQG